MKTVYLLRHGQCESNVAKARYAGLSAKLTEKGLADAKKLAKLLSNIKLDQVVASSTARAVHTAQLITEEHDLPIETTDLFVEREHPSELLGVSRDDEHFKLVTKKVREKFVAGDTYGDEESFGELLDRARDFKVFLEGLDGEMILAVGHGKFTKFFLAYLVLGDRLTPHAFLSLDVFKSRNLGLSEIEFDETKKSWSIRQWNSTFWSWM